MQIFPKDPSPHTEEHNENGEAAAALSVNNSQNSGVNSSKNIITPQEYFSPEVDLNGRDIGQPRKLNTKVYLNLHYVTCFLLCLAYCFIDSAFQSKFMAL